MGKEFSVVFKLRVFLGVVYFSLIFCLGFLNELWSTKYVSRKQKNDLGIFPISLLLLPGKIEEQLICD